MAKLMETSPCAGKLPKTIGTVTLSEVDQAPLAIVQPFKGQADATGAALGQELPKVGRSTGKAGSRVIWFGKETYLTQGFLPEASASAHAAVSDQSDSWAVVALQGDDAEAVLTRLVPVDLRGKTFKRGHTCRTRVEHMNASITRLGEKSFQIMVFRSMAGTLIHDLEQAMAHVAARSGI